MMVKNEYRCLFVFLIYFTIDFEIIANSYLPILNKKMGALKASIKKVEQGTVESYAVS